MKKFHAFFCIVLMISLISLFSPYSQASSDSSWQQTFGGVWDDCGNCVVQTDDGGYIVTGYTSIESVLQDDVFLFKLDANGNIEWNQTYDGDGASDFGKSVVCTADGGYAVAGSWSHYGNYGDQMWLIKTDSDGNADWNQTYSISKVAESIIVTSDGGFALTGYHGSYGYYGFVLVKTDSFGNLEWNQTYVYDRFVKWTTSIVQTSDNGFLLSGYVDSENEDEYHERKCNFLVVKTDSTGNMEWNMTYGGTENDQANTLIKTSDGGYVVAGSTLSCGAGDQDVWLIKIDGNGNAEWNQTYGGSEYDDAMSVIQTIDGGFALTGYTRNFTTGDTNGWLLKLDELGNVVWNRKYGGEQESAFYSLVETSNQTYVMVGQVVGIGFGSITDVWIVKTNKQGILLEPPVASFTYLPDNPQVNDTITFDSSNCVDTYGTIVSYIWDFGDGTTSTSQNPTHVYDQEGSFPVSLTITDNDGLTDSITVTISEIVIPEFSSLIILPMSVLITIAVIVSKNRLEKQNKSEKTKRKC